ncbi:MAG TPA: TetR/AcrR family transcriptional regulator [Myxococcota bacterium]|jgi:AcrR family transcriptional regulator
MAKQAAKRPRRGPGRPRSQDADRAIHAAALEALAGSGYAALSIEGVAARAGVTRPTVYRRFAGKAELVTSAVAAAFETANPAVPATGSAREDVRILLANTIRMVRGTALGDVIRNLIPELPRHPDLRGLARGLLQDRRRLLRTAIERGVQRRELRKDLDVELSIDALLGAIYLRLLITGAPIADRLAGDLVAEILGV